MFEHSLGSAKEWLEHFNWTDIHPNPNVSLAMRLRATFWNVIRRDVAMYDAAKKLGVVPLQSHVAERPNLLFHLIFTTSANSSLTIYTKPMSHVSGALNWAHWRTIESVFFHHPGAKVVVHSNTLDHHVFDVLSEVGYDIEVRPYNLTRLIADSPARRFTAEKMDNASRGEYWYSHSTDLLRMLILYNYGGVYIDTDVIVTRSFDTLKPNVLGFENGDDLNGAVMMFDKGHIFLKTALAKFVDVYTGKIWAEVGPVLLTDIWKTHFNETNSNVHVANRTAFYMFPYQYIRKACFSDVSGDEFIANTEIVKHEAYAVHLYSKMSALEMTKPLKAGTICKYLLNEFCVLCDTKH